MGSSCWSLQRADKVKSVLRESLLCFLHSMNERLHDLLVEKPLFLFVFLRTHIATLL
jgi:hypothetical protein